MRNKQLDDLLASLAYDRGHHAGQDEVNMIHESLRIEFKEIDAMLPHTMPPKFKHGDTVRHKYFKYDVWIDCIEYSDDGYSYKTNIPALAGRDYIVEECDLEPKPTE